MPRVVGDYRRRVGSSRRDDLIAVNAHVGLVGVGEQAEDAGFFRDHAVPDFVFVVLGMNLPRAPDEVDAVRDFRHEGFGETESPVAVLEVGGEADGVAARVCGVVPGAVVVGGPVEKLEVSVGADRVAVEEIRHAEFAEAEFETTAREFVEQREEAALVLNFVFAERDDGMDHSPAEIRLFAEQWVADDIEVGVSSEAEALSERRAAGFLDVDENLGGVIEAHASVERHDARRSFLVVGAETVRAAVERGKLGMGLKHEVGLAREPEARALQMWEHGFGAVVGRRGGRIGSGVRWLRGRRRLRRDRIAGLLRAD